MCMVFLLLFFVRLPFFSCCAHFDIHIFVMLFFCCVVFIFIRNLVAEKRLNLVLIDNHTFIYKKKFGLLHAANHYLLRLCFCCRFFFFSGFIHSHLKNYKLKRKIECENQVAVCSAQKEQN